MVVKRWIVSGLENACSVTHPVTHRRPWLWLPIRNGWCLLSHWSDALDQRWQTGVWRSSDPA